MKTVIATSDGSISSDATAHARQVKFKKGDEVTLTDSQADFLIKCGKAKDKKEKQAPVKKVVQKKETANNTDKKDK